MEAAGSLLGGAIVGIGEAVVGPRVRAAWAGRRGVTEGEPAGSQSHKPRHEENIGKDLTPEERARIMDERTRQIAEEDAAVTRERRARQEARDAERAADKEAIDAATAEKNARIERLKEVKQDPNATPEEIQQAKRDIGEAQKQENALKDDFRDREAARQAAAADDPPNHNGKVYEPALGKDTGDLYIDNQGNTPAQSISRPAESLDPSTAPGHCAMPRAADVARSRAAEQGRPPPDLETTNGGYTIRDGQVEPIDACGNCNAIKSLPENQIETLPNTNTSPPMTVPPPDHSTDGDDYYEDYE